MDRIRIRRMTTSDKENVLAMRDNTKPGPDSLPAYFDHYASIPNAYPAGLFYDEKLAGFSVGHIVDDGMTGVLRASRVSPEFEGRGLMKILHRHVADWARNSGVQSIVSLSDEVPGHTGSERPKRFDKTVFTWRWAQLTFRPDKQKRWVLKIIEPRHEKTNVLVSDLV